MNLKVARATIPITIVILMFGGWLHLRFTKLGWSPYTTNAIDEIWIFNETYERFITHEAERHLDRVAGKKWQECVSCNVA